MFFAGFLRFGRFGRHGGRKNVRETGERNDCIKTSYTHDVPWQDIELYRAYIYRESLYIEREPTYIESLELYCIYLERGPQNAQRCMFASAVIKAVWSRICVDA